MTTTLTRSLAALAIAAGLAAAPAAAQSCQFIAGPAAIDAALAAVNGHRRDAGLGALSVNPRLARAARAHACDMARSGVRSHTGSDGSSVSDRIRAQGYRFCTAAENIAWRQAGLRQAVGSWWNSPPHRANILNRAVRQAGFAGARATNGEPVWVMVVASQC